jgi:hypothetical protein
MKIKMNIIQTSNLPCCKHNDDQQSSQLRAAPWAGNMLQSIFCTFPDDNYTFLALEMGKMLFLDIAQDISSLICMYPRHTACPFPNNPNTQCIPPIIKYCAKRNSKID